MTGNAIPLLLARVGLSIIFILAGFQKLTGIEGTAGYIASVGLPMPTLLAWGAGLFELIAGAFILVGFMTRPTALAFAAFCVVSAVIFHFNFADQIQSILFMKNIAMAGGFLALFASGPGEMAIDAKRSASVAAA